METEIMKTGGENSSTCANCGHPIKMKGGVWKHTNTVDGHVFATSSCQYCIAEARTCREAAAEESKAPQQQPQKLPQPETAAEYKICNICGIYAKNQAAMMNHYRNKHPLDSSRLLLLKMEGKSVEEMARILERTPATIMYHLAKLPPDAGQSKFSEVEMVGPATEPNEDPRMQELERENRDLKSQLEALQSELQARAAEQDGWIQTFHLESSGDGAKDGVQAVRNAIKSILPFFPDYISLDVRSNKQIHKIRISVEVSKK